MSRYKQCVELVLDEREARHELMVDWRPILCLFVTRLAGMSLAAAAVTDILGRFALEFLRLHWTALLVLEHALVATASVGHFPLSH